jgi:CotH kinase protein
MRKPLTLLLLLLSFSIFSQSLFDVKQVREVRVTFAAKDWDKKLDSLKKLGNDFRLIGKVTIDGIAYDSCGIRYKGNSSYNSVRNLETPKLPFNIKANEVKKKQKFIGGYETLKLSNVFRDPSFIREVLSYEIVRKYMPASQANFVRLYVNEKLIGFYNSVEPVEDVLLQTAFGSDKGVLVKCDPDWSATDKKCPPNDKASLTYFSDDAKCYLQYYEMKSKEKVDKIVKFAKILNKEPQNLEKTLNIDQVLWMHALNNTMVNLDSYLGKLSHNYYMYQDTFGIWQPIIWDLNLSFGGFRLDGIEPIPLSNEKMQQLSPFAHHQDAAYPLISQLLKNDTYRKIYVAHLKTILKENFDNDWYLTRAKELQKQIDFYVKNDDKKLYSYEAFLQNIEQSSEAGKVKIIGIKELMSARTAFLKTHQAIAKPAPILEKVAHAKKDSLLSITCKATDSPKVYLYYREKKNAPFVVLEMKDDGTQDDTAANDGIFGLKMPLNQNLEYYIVAVGEQAATLSPERASKEFYKIN